MKVNLNFKALAAEFVGTFFLTLVVLVSINNPDFPVPTPILAALTLCVFVYTIGKVSGTHINPAVTIGQAVIQKIDIPTAIAYIVSQFVGAGVALLIVSLMLGKQFEAVEVGESGFMVGLAEMLGTLLFTFGISAVVHDQTPKGFQGLVVGLSLLLGISLAAIGANGILNPAVAMGIKSFSLAYVWGPVLGSILGFAGYRMLLGNK